MTAQKRSKLLVVDASVAHSAGETEHPMSSSCRDALLAIRKICHRVVMTEAIRDEWNRHMSRFTRKWLVSMVARKKAPEREVEHLDHFLDRVCKHLAADEQDGLRKDLCLIEAACEGDGIIITRDHAIMDIWAKCQNRFGLPKPIRWINPVTDGTEVFEHL